VRIPLIIENSKEFGAFVDYMSITLTLIAFNMGRLLFGAFVSVVLNIMPNGGIMILDLCC